MLLAGSESNDLKGRSHPIPAWRLKPSRLIAAPLSLPPIGISFAPTRRQQAPYKFTGPLVHDFYRVFLGYSRHRARGKNNSLMKSGILPGARSSPWTVPAASGPRGIAADARPARWAPFRRNWNLAFRRRANSPSSGDRAHFSYCCARRES